MSTAQWFVNIGLLAFVLGTNLGTRPVTSTRVLLPLALAAGAGALLLTDVPTLGNDVALDVIGAAAGVAFGILAGLVMRVQRNRAGRIVSTAGLAYTLLWTGVIGGRLLFAEAADGWASASVRALSISARITGADAWTAAFVIMALCMVVTRVATTLVRARGLQARPAPSIRPGRSTALVLTAGAIAATVATALLLAVLLPGLDSTGQRLVAVLLLAVVALGVVAVTNPRMLAGGSVASWLLLVPALVALAPFAGGIKNVGVAATAIVIVGYLATGVYEELWFRGLVLNSLRQLSPLRGALITSALFGLAHLSNLAFGAALPITAAQVVGAACFGVGYAALRLRGVSLWPLVLLHALTDVALHLGGVSTPVHWTVMIGGDIVLLVFGMLVLRRRRTAAPVLGTDVGLRTAATLRGAAGR